MKTSSSAAQLFLRLSLGIGFISAVCDRFGVWGTHGTANVGWGDWAHFLDYSKTLMFFLPGNIAEIFAIIATAAEIIFGLLLIVGFVTRWTALFSGLLLLSFGFSMIFALGVQAPLNYSVFAASAGSFLLATLSLYPWSLDALLMSKSEADNSMLQ